VAHGKFEVAALAPESQLFTPVAGTDTHSAARRVRVAGTPPAGDLVVEVLGFDPRPQNVAVATRAGWGDIVLQL
jgi:hypothetical protein